MKPTKLYESLFILHKCHLTLTRLWTLVGKNNGLNPDNDDYAFIYTNYINMEAVNFLDEFDNGFVNKVEPEFLDRVMAVRKITVPIIKRINKWKDLEKYRNNIIAHPWRHKGKFVVPNQSTYNVPKSWFENAVLVNLMSYLWSMVKVEFLEEMNEASEYIATLQDNQNIISDHSALNDDHLSMAAEVHLLCKSLNKKYHLKVLLYEFPED